MDAEPKATPIAPVSADQRAVLELLLKHRVDYQTIGAVLNAGADGARVRAHDALSAIADAEIDDVLADFMLRRTSAAEHVRVVQSLANDPKANALAARMAARLRAELGEVEIPEIPEPPLTESAAAETSTSSDREEERPHRFRVAFRLTALVLIAASAALLVTAGLPGGSDSADDGQGSGVTDVQDRIPLSAPIGDSRGEAVIGFTTETEAYLELFVNGTEGPLEGRVGVLWMDLDGESGIPLSRPFFIGDDSYHRRFGLPIDLIPALAQAQSLDVVAIRAATVPRLQSEFPLALIHSDPLANAARIPDRFAETVLSGELPALESARALE